MNENPYSPPTAAVRDFAKDGATVRIYSPTQVAGGAFLGGPVGLVYFLQANFAALGNDRGRRATLIGGIALVIVLAVVLPNLPDKTPSSPFAIFYIVVARQVAERYQMTKDAIVRSDTFVFQSNGRVFGLGLLCLVASVAVLIGLIALLAAVGLVKM